MRILALALLAYLAMLGASWLGSPWLGWSASGTLFGLYALAAWIQHRRRRRLLRESRWEQAIYEPAQRARVIAEVSAALAEAKARRVGARRDVVRLSVLLAELYDAGDDWAAARSVIDAVSLTGLSALDEGLVRHTRAVIQLRAADPAAALLSLIGRGPSGDAELDQRLELLEAYARVEQGEARSSLQQAELMARSEELDESVRTEARVVRAAALDALGRREDALVVLAALGRESLTPLSRLGQPRVRALARQILEGMPSE
jgi:hypothetical protein